MMSGHRHIRENLCLSLLFSVWVRTRLAFAPDRKSVADIPQGITSALQRDTEEGHTHSTAHNCVESRPWVLIAVVTYLPHTWVPAQDPVVFGTTQQQFRVSLAPRDRENSPKIDQ